MAGRSGHRRFGWLRRLPSKRWQASYTGPDAARHKAPATFAAKMDGEAWLAAEARLIELGKWSPPADRDKAAGPVTFDAYAASWLSDRELKPRTRAHYARLLDQHILPTFGTLPLPGITPGAVRTWHSSLPTDRPTIRAHCYGLLRAILQTALYDGEIPHNPAHIRGAGNVKRAVKIEPATPAEVVKIADAMPDDRYRLMVLISAWCALRFGELTELRRKDIDLEARVIRVRRAVTRVDGEYVVGQPKSAAGVRDVAIPPHLVPEIRAYLSGRITGGRDGLLFPSTGDPAKHMAPATLSKVFYRARAAAGRPELRWHDLRHTGAVLAAQAGGTLADLMGRLGHSTPQAALRYQHTAQGRDRMLADRLSDLAGT